MTAGEGKTAGRSGARGPTPRRGFRVFDGMILVAATAVGFALTEWIARASNGSHSWTLVRVAWSDLRQVISRGAPAVIVGMEFVYLAVTMLFPLAAMWTLAMIPIGLLGPRPRPRLRRLARRPGFLAACAWTLSAASLGLPLGIAVAASRGIAGFSGLYDMMFYGVVQVWLLVPVCPGLTVLGAWMALIVGRRWRSVPSWVDRLGRLLGAFWVLVAVATVVDTSYLLTHPPTPPAYAPYAPAASGVGPTGSP